MNNVLSFPNLSRTVSTPRHTPEDSNFYCYTLKGVGLEQFHVFDGDIALVDTALPVRDGDFAIIKSADGVACNKVKFKGKNKVILYGDTAQTLPASSVEFLGRVIRIERDFI